MSDLKRRYNELKQELAAIEELESLHQEYDELVKNIDELEELAGLSVGDPGAYYDVNRDIGAAYDALERVSRQIEELVAKKRRQEGGA